MEVINVSEYCMNSTHHVHDIISVITILLQRLCRLDPIYRYNTPESTGVKMNTPLYSGQPQCRQLHRTICNKHVTFNLIFLVHTSKL